MRSRATAVSVLLVGMGAAGLLACGSQSSRPLQPAQSPDPESLFMLGVPRSDHGAVDGVFLYTMEVSTGELIRRDLPHLGIGDPPRFLDVTGGRLAYYGENGTTFSIDLGLTEPPKRLGPSLYFIPSVTPGRVWLRGLPRSSPHPGHVQGVREVDVEGKVSVDGDTHYPPCGWLTTAVRDAVLCQGRKGGLVAVDPDTGRTISRIPDSPFPLASSGDLVATCGEPCPRLRITDPVARRTFWIPPGRGFHWEAGYDGAFSPDGDLIAVAAVPQRSPDDHANSRQVAIVELHARSAKLIDGAAIRQGAPLSFSPRGDLFFLTPDRTVMRYRPADGTLSEVGDASRIDIYDLTAS